MSGPPAACHGVNSPAGQSTRVRDIAVMRKPKHWQQPKVRVHQSRDDRGRTWSGKTASRKVRNEGRYLAALEQDSETKVRYQAAAAKTDQAT